MYSDGYNDNLDTEEGSLDEVIERDKARHRKSRFQSSKGRQ